MGWIARGITEDGSLRLLVVDVTEAAEQTRRRHGLDRGAARVAAEGLAATALLAAQIKGEERLLLQLQAERPAISFAGEVRADGSLRARLRPTQLPEASARRLSGLLLAIKHDASHELYRGISEIRSESLASALRRHLHQSSQVPGALRLEAEQGEGAALRFVGGMYAERLPGGRLEPAQIFEAGPVSSQVRALLKPEQSDARSVRWLQRLPTRWTCTCSRHRVEQMLRSLGSQALQEMADEEGQAEVSCDFCQTTRVIPAERLLALRS